MNVWYVCVCVYMYVHENLQPIDTCIYTYIYIYTHVCIHLSFCMGGGHDSWP